MVLNLLRYHHRKRERESKEREREKYRVKTDERKIKRVMELEYKKIN